MDNEEIQEDVEDKTTEDLQIELDLLYEEIRSPYYLAMISKIVEIELELEKRCNI